MRKGVRKGGRTGGGMRGSAGGSTGGSMGGSTGGREYGREGGKEVAAALMLYSSSSHGIATVLAGPNSPTNHPHSCCIAVCWQGPYQHTFTGFTAYQPFSMTGCMQGFVAVCPCGPRSVDHHRCARVAGAKAHFSTYLKRFKCSASTFGNVLMRMLHTHVRFGLSLI